MTYFARGSRGPEVEQIQRQLNASIKSAQFKKLVPDGIFGSKTHTAVDLFQRENPPLVPDGIVGSNTQARLNDLSRDANRQAANNDLTVSRATAGQVPNSVDCGYFSAFAVACYNQTGGDPRGVAFTQAHVYAARDRHFSGLPAGSKGGPITDPDHYLTLSQAPGFLQSLGISGYWDQGFGLPQLKAMNLAEFDRQLLASTNNGLSGMMISGENLLAGYTHWTAVLSVKSINGENHVLIYNPGGVPSDFKTSVTDLPNGPHMYWLPTGIYRFRMMNTMHHSRSGIVRK